MTCPRLAVFALCLYVCGKFELAQESSALCKHGQTSS
jgi:hypothetical protein